MYACKFYFQYLISVNVHGAICPAVLMFVTSSSPVEGRGRDSPIRKKQNNVQCIEEVLIVRDMARTMPLISASLENRQADHKTSMVDIEGMIKIQPISIFIDLGASLSYISPRIVELLRMLI